jgi:Fe-S-cluster containining protein
MDKNSIICVKCNECCKWMTFTLRPETKRLMDKYTEFYKARSCKVKQAVGGADGNPAYVLTVMVPYMCGHLNLVTGMCDVYDRRPQLCREYDGRWDPDMQDICQLPVESNGGPVVELTEDTDDKA